jgi:predicted site-specific integrase-resolvase
MPIVVQGKEFFRTHEAIKRAGLSRATFFRWLREGLIADTAYKDRRGWRLFTESDIDLIKKEVEKISKIPSPKTCVNSKRGL